jgi:DNA-binding NarL/FixJ family response regulator
MAHPRQATEKGRHIIPGLRHLQELRQGGRDRLYDVSATPSPGQSGPPRNSATHGFALGYPIVEHEHPDARTNGYAGRGKFATAKSLGTVAQVDGGTAVLDVRFLIVDDCKLNRENLAAIFTAHDGSEPAVAWDLPSLRDALAQVAPEIALLNMATRDNLAMLRMVKDMCPEAKVVVVGISEDEESDIVACAEAGVAGYHLRAESLDDLLTVLSRVANGESSCSPKVSAILLRRLSTLAAQRRPESNRLVLTAREIQILRLIESGLSNQEIADHLYIAVHTVKNHVHSLLSKLGVSTRAEAAACLRSSQNRELAGEI